MDAVQWTVSICYKPDFLSADHILADNQPALSPTSFYIVAIRLLGNDFRTFEYFQSGYSTS